MGAASSWGTCSAAGLFAGGGAPGACMAEFGLAFTGSESWLVVLKKERMSELAYFFLGCLLLGGLGADGGGTSLAQTLKG